RRIKGLPSGGIRRRTLSAGVMPQLRCKRFQSGQIPKQFDKCPPLRELLPAIRANAHFSLGRILMRMAFRALLGACAIAALTVGASAETTLTIATVNNGDMIRMQKLTDDFTSANPDIKLNWVTLEENVLRQKVTTDIATKGGQYDVLTIGTYEVPIWAKKGWLVPLDNLGADYDVDDLL